VVEAAAEEQRSAVKTAGGEEEVVKRTEAECAEGKAIGPLMEEQVDALWGRVWAPARRVGLVQTGGVRPLDDFSGFGHNAPRAPILDDPVPVRGRLPGWSRLAKRQASR
jgi:hypothetical protein